MYWAMTGKKPLDRDGRIFDSQTKRILQPSSKHIPLISFAMAFPIAERRTGIVHLRMPPKCSKKRTIISFLLRIATAVSIGVAVLPLWWRNSFQL